MSIWFGGTPSQTDPKLTDEDGVKDRSSPPPGQSADSPTMTSGPFDALRDAADDASAEPAPEIFEIFRLHDQVVEAEHRAGRFLAKAGARKDHAAALAAESAALERLGFKTYKDFFAVHGVHSFGAHENVDRAAESVDRIRVLLGQMGVEAGEDPLNTAKEVLAHVAVADIVPLPPPAPAYDFPAPTPEAAREPEAESTLRGEPAAPLNLDPFVLPRRNPAPPEPDDQVAASAPPAIPEADELAASAEPPAPEIAAFIELIAPSPVAPIEPVTADDFFAHPIEQASIERAAADGIDESYDRVDARAERWYSQLEHAREELVVLSTARDTAQRELAETSDELHRVLAELDRTQRRAESAEANFATRAAERDDAIARHEALESELNAAREELARLHEATDDRADVISRAESAERRVAEMEAALTDIDAARARLEAELQLAQARNTELDILQTRLGDRVGELERLLERRAEDIDGSDRRASDLAAQIEQMEATIEELHAAVAAREAERDAVKQQLETARLQVATLQATITDHDHERDILTAHRDRLEHELDELLQRHSSGDTQLRIVEEQLATTRVALEQITADREDLAAELARVEALVRAVEQERDDARQTAQQHDTRLRDVQLQLQSRGDDIARLEAAVATHESEHEATTIDLTAARERVMQLEEVLDGHAAERELARADLERAQAEQARLTVVVEERTRERDETRSELQQARAETARLELALAAQIEEKAGEVDDVLTQLEDARSEVTGLEAAFASEIRDHESARNQLAQARAEITRLEETAAHAESERTTAASELNDTRARIRRLESEVAELTRERDGLREATNEARTNAETLAERLAGAQSMIDSLTAHSEDLERELDRALAAIPSKDARRQADEIVSAARAEGDDLRRQAMTEAESIRKDALATARSIRDLAQEDAREIGSRAQEVALGEAQRTDLVSALLERVAKLERRLAKQQKRLQKAADRIERAKDAEHAGLEAEEIIERAEQQAGTWRAEAEAAARRERVDAERYAAKTRAEAEEFAQRLRTTAEREATKQREQAEKDAAKIREHAKKERQKARDELAVLLARISPEANENPD